MTFTLAKLVLFARALLVSVGNLAYIYLPGKPFVGKRCLLLLVLLVSQRDMMGRGVVCTDLLPKRFTFSSSEKC